MKLYDTIFKEDAGYNGPDPIKIRRVVKWQQKHNLKNLLDVGCGRGHYLRETGAFGIEPSRYLCDEELREFNVACATILSFNGSGYDGFYCMDVLEHVMPHELDATLKKLATFASRGFLGIANHSDVWNGVELHLIKEDAAWWGDKLQAIFKEVTPTGGDERFFMFEVSNV